MLGFHNGYRSQYFAVHTAHGKQYAMIIRQSFFTWNIIEIWVTGEQKGHYRLMVQTQSPSPAGIMFSIKEDEGAKNSGQNKKCFACKAKALEHGLYSVERRILCRGDNWGKIKMFMACIFFLQIKRALLNSMNNIYSYNLYNLFYGIEKCYCEIGTAL